MKFGQLIEHNMRKIFLKQLFTNCGVKTSNRTFFKKSKLSISLDQYSEVLYSLFFFAYPIGGQQKYIEIMVLTTCFSLE